MTRAPAPPPGPTPPDSRRVSWLVITGGFAALAALLLVWVAITVVRSVTEPVPGPARGEVEVSRPPSAGEQTIVVSRPTPTAPTPRIGD